MADRFAQSPDRVLYLLELAVDATQYEEGPGRPAAVTAVFCGWMLGLPEEVKITENLIAGLEQIRREYGIPLPHVHGSN